MKMTKREKFEMLKAIPAVAENEMLMEFINHEMEILSRKNSPTTKKPTANQLVNEGVKEAIAQTMEPGKLYTITDMIKTFPCCNDMSNQRVNALVRQMMPERVERVKVKGKALFAVPGVIQTEEVGE